MTLSPVAGRPAGLAIFGQSVAFWLTALLIACCFLFGGASRGNLAQVVLLEVLSVPLLLFSVRTLVVEGGWRSLGLAGLILVLLPVIPLLQLIPVPFDLWSALPGHGPAAEAAIAAGLPQDWRPISLAPVETWRSLLALCPPAAIFLGVLLCSDAERRRLCLLVCLTAIGSLLIGALQLAGGSDSPLYFYSETNLGSPVGLFANRNHQANLLAVSLPYAALWLCEARPELRRMAPIAIGLAAYTVMMVVGLVIVGSRAGVLLAAPAAVLAAALLYRADRIGGWRGLAAMATVGIVAMIAAFSVIGPVAARFAAQADQRFDTAPVVAAAAWKALPLGTGVGSFPAVYAGVEPVELMAATYFNHAHNDYLEIWLETGAAGILLLLAFIVWWVRQSLGAWLSAASAGRNLARVGSAAIALLLVHSLVDYPVRTLALAAMLALSAGLLTTGPSASRAGRP